MTETKNVYRVYDEIANWFDRNRSRVLIEKPYLDVLAQYLKQGSTVLDLGCGTGEPIMHFLLEQGYKITGVDASHAMLALAREYFPTVHLVEADMRTLELHERFDAVIAWHSFFHLPHDDQRAMFGVFARHINPRGVLIFTSGPEHGEAWGDNGGQMLYHASLAAEEYRALLDAHGFSVLQHAVEDEHCGGATVWIAQQR